MNFDKNDLVCNNKPRLNHKAVHVKKYTLEEIKAVMKEEGIGNSSTQYVIDKLARMDKESEPVVVMGPVHVEIKKMPYYMGVVVSPQSTNHVTIDHNGERCQLHFLENGNFGLSRPSNRNSYLEIDKDQAMNLLLSKF